jgi:hypothetical protein
VLPIAYRPLRHPIACASLLLMLLLLLFYDCIAQAWLSLRT